MLFCDPFFLFVFLPLSLTVYYLSPRRLKNLSLSILSLIFYWVGEELFLPLLVLSILLNYIIGRMLIDEEQRGRQLLLALGIGSDLGLLLVFKYAGFFAENTNSLLRLFGAESLFIPQIALPLGISFFTFHKISYKIDLYRRTVSESPGLVDLFLYMLLFPQLIAGPIIRYQEIAAQLVVRRTTLAGFSEGVQRFILGLGKKMIIANTVALPADQIFALPASHLSPSLAWFGAVCYALQIYFDFSGYSDMAIGLGKMFGFTFPENFNRPYAARSLTEFWRRWHMSLSRWFKDYVYIPLGGSRGSPVKTYCNLFTVFLLCGLWHGASWNFIVWGLWHGMFLALEHRNLNVKSEPGFRMVRHAYTLLIVLIGWVFFRSGTLADAATYLMHMFGFGGPTLDHHLLGLYLNGELLMVLILAAAYGVAPLAMQTCASFRSQDAGILSGRNCGALQLVALALVFFYSLILVASSSYNPFIYYRF